MNYRHKIASSVGVLASMENCAHGSFSAMVKANGFKALITLDDIKGLWLN